MALKRLNRLSSAAKAARRSVAAVLLAVAFSFRWWPASRAPRLHGRMRKLFFSGDQIKATSVKEMDWEKEKSRSPGSRPSVQIAQLTPQDLADVRFRQLRSELDDFRPFVVCQAFGAEGLEFRFRQRLILLDDESLTVSPECSSGTLIAAHSSTPGWLAATSSISFG